MDKQARKLPRTVLLVTDHERLYGANRSLFDLAVYLKEKKGVTPIVLIQRPGRLSEALTERGIENHCMLFRKWCYLPGDKKRFAFARDAYDWVMRQKIRRLMAGKHIDLVHTNVSTTCMGDDLAHYLGVPHVWYVREFVPEAFPYVYRYPMARVAERFSRADAVVAISQALAKSFREKYPQANVRMVYNGVNLTHTAKEFHSPEVVSFCCVGRLCPQKNQMGVLKALLVLKDRGKDFRVHFYGEGSDRQYEDALYALVKENGLADKVIFHGYSASVLADLTGYDVGLVVSSYEAFGRTTVEFMNASMPVIGADSGATPELITEGVNGLICPLDDPGALADAMQRFIDDREAIKAMGRAAYENVAERFSIDRMIGELLGVYGDCLADRAEGKHHAF